MKRITIQVSDLTHQALQERGKPHDMDGTDWLKHVVTTSAMGHDIPLELGSIVARLRSEKAGLEQHPQLPLATESES
jgi:hypothetical protein